MFLCTGSITADAATTVDEGRRIAPGGRSSRAKARRPRRVIQATRPARLRARDPILARPGSAWGLEWLFLDGGWHCLNLSRAHSSCCFGCWTLAGRSGIGLYIGSSFASFAKQLVFSETTTAPENAGDLGRKREGKGGEEEKERENFEDSLILIP